MVKTHVIDPQKNLYVEARRLIAEGADPDDAVVLNGVRMNGALGEIAGTHVEIQPDGTIETRYTGAAAKPNAKFRVHTLKALDLVTGSGRGRKQRNRQPEMQMQVKHFLSKRYPDGVPDKWELPSRTLCRFVKADIEAKNKALRLQGIDALQMPSDDTILRAAGRKLWPKRPYVP